MKSQLLPILLLLVTAASCIGTRPAKYDVAEVRQDLLCQVEGADRLVLEPQRELRDCTVACVRTLLSFLSPEAAPSWDEVEAALHPSDPDHVECTCHDQHGYVSLQRVVDYVNGLQSRERGGCRLELRTKQTFEDLCRAIEETKRPVLVPYMVDVLRERRTIAANLALYALGSGLARKLNGGDRFLLRRYLHLGVVREIGRNPGDPPEEVVVIGDPWSGIPLVSKASPGWDTLDRRGFERRWTSWEQMSTPDAPLAIREWYEHDLRPKFEELAAPSSLVVCVPETYDPAAAE